MAYRYGNREQISFLPASIEEYVGLDDPVRAYDAFVEALDMSEIGIVEDEEQVGNPEYDPRSMLKLLVYGYSYGYRSSRKLERALHHNLSFIWLMGGLRPDHKTISQFRREHTAGLQQVLKQSVRMCVKLGLIEGNTLFVDGTKIRANASVKTLWTEHRCVSELSAIDRRIRALLEECESTDRSEEGMRDMLRMPDELRDAEALRAQVRSVLAELQSEGKRSLNRVDRESRLITNDRGSIVGYNAQLVVDEKHGLIVSSDVVSSSNDTQQLSRQIAKAEAVVEKHCDVAVADKGYYSSKEFQVLEERGTTVVVPTPALAGDEKQQGFEYREAEDCYICPEGHRMIRHGASLSRHRRRYIIKDVATCKGCKRYGVCTSSRQSFGRVVHRNFYKDVADRVARRFPAIQPVFDLRKQKVELPFGHFRRNMGVQAFLLRGFAGVRAELALLANSFNLTRMMTILGVRGLCVALRG